MITSFSSLLSHLISQIIFFFFLCRSNQFVPSMESAAVIRSIHHSMGTASHVRPGLEKPGVVPIYNAAWPNIIRSRIQGLTFGGKIAPSIKRENMLVSCAKTTETTVFDSRREGPLEKGSLRNATFPNGFEALVQEVCDETEIAELKLKVGDFEMHLKRNIRAVTAPTPIVFPTPPPSPPQSKPMIESTSSAPPPTPPKSSTEKISPFTNVSVEKSAKLAALEASGSNGYVLVSSPTVGSFRRGRTLKGKKQPNSCKEGDIIKEGQVIGFLDQFGTQLPVKSDVAGEILKILFNDGEAVGYGDPLIAVLPSFPGIK